MKYLFFACFGFCVLRIAILKRTVRNLKGKLADEKAKSYAVKSKIEADKAVKSAKIEGDSLDEKLAGWNKSCNPRN